VLVTLRADLELGWPIAYQRATQPGGDAPLHGDLLEARFLLEGCKTDIV
jgi:hypothetical protein